MGFVHVFTILLLFTNCQCEEKPLVKTPLGEIRGSTGTSFGGKAYSAFEGIPFAKPPIGDRRFEAPEPVEPWLGVWNATFRTECLQTTLPDLNPTRQFDEDCLHLNVYVPREVPNPEETLDVIVHIHGGSYMYCSGHCYTTPKYLMDRDVIFVTFNYRLGIFGFLSTEDDVVPGNNGLKDQVMALRWVQDNIASFGGNPASVTLNGGSAGAAAVHLHYLSDMSKGLFHRGYSQSGAALNPFNVQKEPLIKAKILANAVGCPTSSSGILVQCLKQRPHQHILAALSRFFGVWIMPITPFGPAVEKTKKPFLKADPYLLITRGEVYDVPWIASTTVHEGSVPMTYLKEHVEEFDEKWEEWAPYFLEYNYTIPKPLWKETARKLKNYYLGENQHINKENLMKVGQMWGDRMLAVGAETAVREQAKVTKSPVYYYLFTYPGDDNEDGIVEHAIDSKYMYNNAFSTRPLTPNEIKMKDVLLDMLTSYAKTGTPSIQGVIWEPVGHDEMIYLNVSGYEPEHIKLEKVEELTPRSFWKSLGL